ncbi:MAG: MlaA family lipoprotein [Gammaproteobacteria bacterium]
MNKKVLFTVLAVLLLGASGCATQPVAENGSDDPAEPPNRAMYTFNDKVDEYVLRPVAEKYAEYTPKVMREGVTNFFDNLTYLNVMLNNFLQGKVVKGFSDVGRIVVNTTLGIGGLFDPASAWGIPKHKEDFGQTLAVWGAGEGAYLVLPFLGPSSVRDAPDYATSTLLNPFLYITSPIIAPISILGIINKRANLLEATRLRDEAALDPYTFTREAYRQKRTNDIYDGNPPREDLNEFIEEENGRGVLRIK